MIYIQTKLIIGFSVLQIDSDGIYIDVQMF